MHLIEQAACMDGSRLALLEAGLVYLGRDEVRTLLVDLGQYSLLHNLREV